jgi:nucleoside 2-deoxyribosyltransferase
MAAAESPQLNQVIDDNDHQLSPHNNRHKHPNFVVFMPTTPVTQPIYENPVSIFLAGSIEMGNAIPWQAHLTEELRDLEVTVCNPRRGKWSTNLNPEATDDLFKNQVEWELAALEAVDIIVFFFDKNTLSPVTMLELGLEAKSGKVVVCCHKDFWKSGNIHHACKKYNVPYVKDYTDFILLVRKRVEETMTKSADTSISVGDEQVKNTLEVAEALRDERDAMEKKAKEVLEEARFSKAAVPTIHQYQKYIRPAWKVFKDDTESLEESEQKQLWNKLCSFK